MEHLACIGLQTVSYLPMPSCDTLQQCFESGSKFQPFPLVCVMTPTIDMADTGHDTDHADCSSYQTRTPSGSMTSYHPTGYWHTTIQQMEILETDIDFALLVSTWTS